MNVHLSLNYNTLSRTERKYHETQQASPHSSKMAEPHGLTKRSTLRGTQVIDDRSKLQAI